MNISNICLFVIAICFLLECFIGTLKDNKIHLLEKKVVKLETQLKYQKVPEKITVNENP